ncbi:MAG: hypothetical protein KJP07_15865 [Desulfatitalea sp.]|nr:hypothetical protein [Desulfatitalea sp.]
MNESGAGKKYILIFSDLQEDLADGYVRDVPLQLAGYEVIALWVTKLQKDILDPKNYKSRVAQWRAKVENGGGKWDMINDLDRLEKVFP